MKDYTQEVIEYRRTIDAYIRYLDSREPPIQISFELLDGLAFAAMALGKRIRPLAAVEAVTRIVLYIPKKEELNESTYRLYLERPC